MKSLIIEGRYDGLVTQLSNKLLGLIKSSYSAVTDPNGTFSGQKILRTSFLSHATVLAILKQK